jgi:electron transfer flavoprotein beta subunit
MDVLACIKRVPDTGAKIVLTDDQRGIDASNLGYTMSPHEECAIEEAIQLAGEHGGTATVLTLGPPDAEEQLREGLAMTADEATLLETDGEEWAPRETAGAIAEAVRQAGAGDGADDDLAFDLLLFGNESADAGNYQVPIRVARELGLPVVAGIKDLTVEDGRAIARREVSGGEEVYELDLPAVVSVKEGINEPRYASMRAKMQARKQEVGRVDPVREDGSGTLEMVRLETPEEDDSAAEILGEGPEAAPRVVEVLRDDVEVL